MGIVMHHIGFMLVVIVLFYVQGTLGRLTPHCPDLGPILAVYLGLFAQKERVGAACLLLGLMRAALDLEPAAALVLLYLAVAQTLLLVREIVFIDRILTQWVCAFAGAALYIVLYRVASLALPMGAVQSVGMMPKLAVATLGASLVAPPVFALLRVLRVGP
jgi:hypothetical protein